jgi:hypothetical protein
MRCHQHLEADAVAVCVGCGRGLCRDCQQPVLDQRILCGWPQCEEFAKRQAAVAFVLRQDCANKAAQYQMFSAMYRAVSCVVFIPSALFVLVQLFSFGLNPSTITGSSFVLMGCGGILILLATVLWRYQARMLLLQRNWQDLSSEFGSRDNVEARSVD